MTITEQESERRERSLFQLRVEHYFLEISIIKICYSFLLSRSFCLCLCVHVRLYVYVHVYESGFVCMHMRGRCAFVCMYVCMHICLCIHAKEYSDVHMMVTSP